MRTSKAPAALRGDRSFSAETTILPDRTGIARNFYGDKEEKEEIK